MVVPVFDLDRVKSFYETLGFRLDIDHVASEDFPVVQLTHPGSECSIIIGNGITSAVPGSVEGLQLVFDIEAARAELVDRGVNVSEVFHDVGACSTTPEPTDGKPAGSRTSRLRLVCLVQRSGRQWLAAPRGQDARPRTMTGRRSLKEEKRTRGATMERNGNRTETG